MFRLSLLKVEGEVLEVGRMPVVRVWDAGYTGRSRASPSGNAIFDVCRVNFSTCFRKESYSN